MSDAISDGCELELEMMIHEADGELLEETEDGHPFRCRVGAQELPPGLERELMGKSSGDAFDVMLDPEDAFGAHDPGHVISIPRSDLPEGEEVAVGDLLPLLLEPEEGEEGEEEEVELEVVAVDGDAISVDLNHPYAGKPLRFSGRVVSVAAGE